MPMARKPASGPASDRPKTGPPPSLGTATASRTKNTSTAPTPGEHLGQFQAIAQAGFGGVNSSGRCLPNANVNPVPASIAPAKSGALIGAVFCNEPAAAAGVRAGDVIIAVNGRTVTSAASLHEVIHGYRPGTTVSLRLVGSNGEQRSLSLKLGQGPAA